MKNLQSRSGSGLTIRELDQRRLFFGKGKPSDPNSEVLHKVTQGELKNRNKPDGQNFFFIANVSVVIIYQYWEDHYRKTIAEKLELDPQALLIPIFGDLRLLRRSIIHHRAISLAEIDKCEELTWFAEGDKIEIDKDQI